MQQPSRIFNLGEHNLKYKYHIWGADVFSDKQINIEDEHLKRKLITLKIQIDKEVSGVFAGKFIIKENKIQAFPESFFNCGDMEEWKMAFSMTGREIPIYYEDYLDTKEYEPYPVYKYGSN